MAARTVVWGKVNNDNGGQVCVCVISLSFCYMLFLGGCLRVPFVFLVMGCMDGRRDIGCDLG